MKPYFDLVERIVSEGVQKGDRTGTGTISVFGHQMKFDLSHSFPLLAEKKTNFDAIVHELLWFISGDTNTKYLVDNGVNIWNEWADENGDLGPVYGKQWRSWSGANGETVDQIKEVVNNIKNNPDSRRLIVSAWNPTELPDESISPQDNVAQGRMALAPCHCFFQFYVANGKLSCQLYQRSADVFLGVPFNIASYALLTMMIAKSCGLGYGDFIHTIGDAHIYLNHLDQVDELLKRDRNKSRPFVSVLSPMGSIFDIGFSEIKLFGYHPDSYIKAPISV